MRYKYLFIYIRDVKQTENIILLVIQSTLNKRGNVRKDAFFLSRDVWRCFLGHRWPPLCLGIYSTTSCDLEHPYMKKKLIARRKWQPVLYDGLCWTKLTVSVCMFTSYLHFKNIGEENPLSFVIWYTKNFNFFITLVFFIWVL